VTTRPPSDLPPEELTPDQARALLEERARRLAERSDKEEAQVLELVEFSIGRERYAIESRHIRRVAALSAYTPVPGLPDPFVGVAPVRDEIVALVSLTSLLGTGDAGVTDLKQMVVLGAERDELALLVDVAEDLAHVSPQALLPVPESWSIQARALIRGVTQGGLIVLDGAALLDDPRLFVEGGEHGAA